MQHSFGRALRQHLFLCNKRPINIGNHHADRLCWAFIFRIHIEVLSCSSLSGSLQLCFQPNKRKGSWSLSLVPHRPYTVITVAIFVSLPWRPADVQVRVWSAGEHHHGSCVPHHGGKT